MAFSRWGEKGLVSLLEGGAEGGALRAVGGVIAICAIISLKLQG